MTSRGGPSNKELKDESNESCLGTVSRQDHIHLLDETYAQGTKFNAVAGGMRFVPLNMTGLYKRGVERVSTSATFSLQDISQTIRSVSIIIKE